MKVWFSSAVNTIPNNYVLRLFSRHPGRLVYLMMGLSFLFIYMAISRQSIWIDEAITATYAMQSSFTSFAREMWTTRQSEAQLPLGMAQAFLFEKILGNSEFALRLPNLFWIGLGIIAFGRIGSKLKLPWIPLLIGVHPMIWFYADEARPYAMQIGIAAIMLWASIEMLLSNRIEGKTLALWWIASFALCASSLMAAVVYTGWFLTLAYNVRSKIPSMTAKSRTGSLITLLLLSFLAVYYCVTVYRGAGGSRLWGVGLRNIAFTAFEFGGFMAFSPGRAVIREAARQNPTDLFEVMRYYILPLFLLAAIYCTLLASFLLAARKSALPHAKLLGFCLQTIAICTIIVLSICMIVNFPFWGRHLVALLPPLLLVIALAIDAVHQRYKTILLMVFLGFLLAGSLNQRFNSQHRKDDYRYAVQVAQEAEAEQLAVLWVANIQAANYYQYEPTLSYRSMNDRQDWREADLVIYSKPDIFDPNGKITRWMHASGFEPYKTWPAFSLWRKSP